MIAPATIHRTAAEAALVESVTITVADDAEPTGDVLDALCDVLLSMGDEDQET